MLKKVSELTEEDKNKFYKAAKKDFEDNYDVPWHVVEQQARLFLDQAFNDKLFPKMNPNDQIEAAHCRKAFNNTKPSLVDYMIWTGLSVTHSEWIEIPEL